MKGRLDRLLRPRTIAIVGGGAWCANAVEQCRRIDFAGEVWTVHRDRRTIGGIASVARVADLPSAPDAAFIGVNRTASIEVVRDLAAMGAGGAVCFAAGFAEADRETGDGRSLQEALLQAAGEIPMLGPNCYGFLNYFDRALLWPDQHGGRVVERGVAIVTQSSNIAINMTMQARGLPIGYVVTAGNQAQTGLAEIAGDLLSDDRVTALGLHIEGIGDLEALEALAAHAHRLGKPVVVLKTGRSAQAQSATMSHTASMAGEAAAASALFHHFGFAETPTIELFLDVLKVLHVAGPITSDNVASMSCSGGEAALMADLAATTCLKFPPLSETQVEALSAVLGPQVRLDNPLDYNTFIWPDARKMAATFSAMMQGGADTGIVVLDFPRTDRADDTDWAEVVTAVIETAKRSGKRMVVMASLPETMPEPWADKLVEAGIIPLCGMETGLKALALARQIRIGTNPIPVQKHRVVRKSTTLSETEAKILLAEFGMPVPVGRHVPDPETAARAADEIGYPVALKTSGLAHKSESGGVALSLPDAASVLSAAAGMPGADGLVVEKMVVDGVAELLIGISTDGVHGYLLTIAMGGVLTEVIADKVHLMVPATDSEVINALDELRCAPLLRGFRGRPAADRQAIVGAVRALQDAVIASQGAIVEAEVNPLIVCADGAWAADALIRSGEVA